MGKVSRKRMCLCKFSKSDLGQYCVCMCVLLPWFVALGCCCWMQKQTAPPSLVLFYPRHWEARLSNQSSGLLFSRWRSTREKSLRDIIHHSSKKLPRVCWPTEHLTAVFDDVLVAVRVLDSVLSRPGTFNLGETKRTQLSSQPFQKPLINIPNTSLTRLLCRSVLSQKDFT